MGRIQEAGAMRGSGRLEMRMSEKEYQAGIQFGRERLGVNNAWSHREFVEDVKRLEPQFGVKTVARRTTLAVPGRGQGRRTGCGETGPGRKPLTRWGRVSRTVYHQLPGGLVQKIRVA
jgi:hypothetical protein